MKTLAFAVLVLFVSMDVSLAGSVAKTTSEPGTEQVRAERRQLPEVDLRELFASPLPLRKAPVELDDVRAPPEPQPTGVKVRARSRPDLWRCHGKSKSRSDLARCLSDKRVSTLAPREASMPPVMEIVEVAPKVRSQGAVKDKTWLPRTGGNAARVPARARATIGPPADLDRDIGKWVAATEPAAEPAPAN